MNENEISKHIVDAAYRVHVNLGPGLLEHVYEVVLAHELEKRELDVRRQVPVSITYDGLAFDEGYRADLIVNGLVLVELKSIEALSPVHPKQVLTYLRLLDLKLGLLINFNEAKIKNGIKRIINGQLQEALCS
ncbi:MAG: GxxExxY protein [Verrucomicrobiota bacterium]